MKIAELSQDRPSIAALTPLLETAARERTDLRRRIQEHESMPVADAANA